MNKEKETKQVKKQLEDGLKVDDTPMVTYKVFEDVTRKNINAIVEYAKDTRALTKKLEVNVATLEKHILMQNQMMAELRQQLAYVQTKLYSKGTSG